MDLVNRWIMVQHTVQRLLGESHYSTMRHVRCVDGFRVSVQVGVHNYSTPREYCSPHTEVECGYPTEPVPEWAEYGESVIGDTNVYAYVPVELVEQVLLQHGGIEGFNFDDEGVEQLTDKRLFTVRTKRKGAVVKDPATGQPLYFSNKMLAKRERDAIGGEAVVSLGPDHWRRNESE